MSCLNGPTCFYLAQDSEKFRRRYLSDRPIAQIGVEVLFDDPAIALHRHDGILLAMQGQELCGDSCKAELGSINTNQPVDPPLLTWVDA
ncbi:hypothetical protein Xseb_22395 [Xanthomonas citri pv. sesbaniae]|uniref:Uncharacterized protein n=1 Tax=Xanthomonas citri pv. sesbaniae TaxID=473425 RepID=A0AAW4RFH0_XANCI|nr:hypothetical protein [Xanthomonas citri pv. sesbaniae]